MTMPEIIPEMIRNGKYKNTFTFSTMAAARLTCAKLCAVPPPILTPIMLNFPVFLSKIMMNMLNIAPLNANNAPNY